MDMLSMATLVLVLIIVVIAGVPPLLRKPLSL